MTKDLLLSSILFILVIVVGYLIVFRLKKLFPYILLRFFLLLVAIIIIMLGLGAFELLPDWAGIAFLFFIEGASFLSVLYMGIGLILVIAVIVLIVNAKKRIKKSKN